MTTKENVLTRTDDFIKWFLPKIEKFPRNYKFPFGDRLAPRPLDFFPGRGEHVARGRGLAPWGFYIFQRFFARPRTICGAGAFACQLVCSTAEGFPTGIPISPRQPSSLLLGAWPVPSRGLNCYSGWQAKAPTPQLYPPAGPSSPWTAKRTRLLSDRFGCGMPESRVWCRCPPAWRDRKAFLSAPSVGHHAQSCARTGAA